MSAVLLAAGIDLSNSRIDQAVALIFYLANVGFGFAACDKTAAQSASSPGPVSIVAAKASNGLMAAKTNARPALPARAD